MKPFALASLVLILSVSSPSATSAPAATSAPVKPTIKAVVAKPIISDAEIERKIRERFAASKINQNHFQVKVTGGTAILEGRTDVIQHKGTATRLAKLAGAKSVKNNIVVSEKAKAKAQANLAEGRRRAQVKRGESRSQVKVVR